MAENLLAGFPIVVELPVYWGEMDSFGHVNNIWYFRYFEQARLAYLRRIGWTNFTAASGIGVILGSVEARYRKPLQWPDTIDVGARISNLADDRMTMEHKVVSRQLGLVAEGKGVIVCYDYGKATKAPIPDELRGLILELERQAGTPSP